MAIFKKEQDAQRARSGVPSAPQVTPAQRVQNMHDARRRIARRAANAENDEG